MKSLYKSIFKQLIKSYHDETFDKEVNQILLSNSNIDKEDLAKAISYLCGVDVSFDNNYIKNLKDAIKNYDPLHKVVNKLSCNGNCTNSDEKPICEKSCPINAIFKDPNDNKIYINNEICIDCGKCIDNCPEGHILDKKEFIPLLDLLKGNDNVIAAVAPSIIGQFGENVTMNQLRSAFKKLGFTDMIEVAFFADMLTIKEAVEYDHFVKDKNDFMITSCCCPMWVGMLKKVYNDLVKYVSPSVSPMIAAGRVIKKLNPNCKVVFVGPCIAKKAEAKEKDLLGAIDFVLTFSELEDIFSSFNINPKNQVEDNSNEYASKGGRIYARTGGVSLAVSDVVEELFPHKFKLLKATQANGVRECKDVLDKLTNKELSANFIEGMGCIGGCVGGPKAIIDKKDGKECVDKFANDSKIKIPTDSDHMKYILSKLDIVSIKDFKDENKIKIFERHF